MGLRIEKTERRVLRKWLADQVTMQLDSKEDEEKIWRWRKTEESVPFLSKMGELLFVSNVPSTSLSMQ